MMAANVAKALETIIGRSMADGESFEHQRGVQEVSIWQYR